MASLIPTALVVEDDKAIAELLRDTLEHEGFQVQVEKDGDWALQALGRRLPSVLVCDVLLPNLGGFELIDHLRRMPGGAHVPVVMISGIYRGSRHKKTAEERLGAVAFLEKPFEMKELVRTIKGALGGDYPKRGTASAAPKPARAQPEHGDDPFADVDTKAEQSDVERAEESFSGPRVAKGNLKNKRFPEVLSQLYRWRSTGGLLLRRERTKKIVYLKEGYPIFVKSNLLSECLGRVLVREKMISDEECERSLLLMKERPGRQQGTVLIEMGCLSPHNLVFGLQLQLEQKLFDVFGWPDGDYQFSSTVEIPPTSVHLDMSLATIVYEGVRRKMPEPWLDDVLEPALDAYLAVHPDPAHRFQEIALEADERRFVALIDGRKPAREILRQSPLSRLHSKQLLYTLLATETIQAQLKQAKKKDPFDVDHGTSSGGVGPARMVPPPLKKAGRNDAGFASTPDAGATDEQRALRKRLVDRARAMRRQTMFEMLGVSRSASPDEIQRAYFALSKELHPDRLRGLPADVRALADQIVAQLQAAYDALADADKRAEQLARLERGSGRAGDELSRILGAEARFKKGEAALVAGDAQRASSLFREAIDMYPEEGEFHAHLGWALFLATPDDATAQADAKQRIEHGISLSPRSDRAYLYLGRVLNRMGRPREAQRQFEQALVCNPDSQEALAELRLSALPTRAPPRRKEA